MKLIEDPIEKNYGICYITYLTDEFEKLINSAIEKIEPFSKKEISSWTYYFKVKDEEVSSEFDCCDNEKCIKQTKADIREQYGKGIHVKKCYTDNNGDHENIEICCQCGKPLNEDLTWCKNELEYLEQNEWTKEFLIQEGFLIYCILNSMPTNDYSISQYAKYQKGDILKEALEKREIFFQRIFKLVQTIIDINF